MAEAGKVLTVEFTLAGTPYQALNGGPHFQLDEAVSISVRTEDQAETDQLWDALLADGGSESQCGWLKDRFGLSWQIVPERAVELLSGPDGPKAFAALMQMVKIDVAGLEAACGTG
jgi:predicted 3-demethylubiquinone-9 3-methyltransferase (glyoxalase superfamily)